jgi:hypothetical protein
MAPRPPGQPRSSAVLARLTLSVLVSSLALLQGDLG